MLDIAQKNCQVHKIYFKDSKSHSQAHIISDGLIVVAGGFNGKDYSHKVQSFNPEDNRWRFEVSGLNEPRFDLVCKSTVVRNEVIMLAIGGWNKDGNLNTTEYFDSTTKLWQIFGNDDDIDVASINDGRAHLRRSGSVYGDLGGPVLVGGVSCGKDSSSESGKKCERSKTALMFVADPVDPALDYWEVISKEMGEPRSSHSILNLPFNQVCA